MAVTPGPTVAGFLTSRVSNNAPTGNASTCTCTNVLQSCWCLRLHATDARCCLCASCLPWAGPRHLPAFHALLPPQGAEDDGEEGDEEGDEGEEEGYDQEAEPGVELIAVSNVRTYLGSLACTMCWLLTWAVLLL